MSTQSQASKSTQTHASNVYSMYKQNVQKYFENVSKITPEYFQDIIQLQEECMKTCEKTINTSISTQQEFANRRRLLKALRRRGSGAELARLPLPGAEVMLAALKLMAACFHG